MTQLAAILSCLILGKVVALTRLLPSGAHRALNRVVIWVSLPAVVLVQIPALLMARQSELIFAVPISMAWILFALSFATFTLIGRFLRWSRQQTGALILTAGLGNTSFVGYPLIEALHGPEGLRIAVLADQPGTFLVLSTLGLITASFYSHRSARTPSPLKMAGDVLRFPPFLSMIVAVLWFASGTYGPGALLTALKAVSFTLAPLALFSLGFQVKISGAVLRRRWKPLALGLVFKLFFGPLFFILFYVHLLGFRDFATRITILESAMAPMLMAAVMADEFELDPELAGLMVGVGIPLALATVPLWNGLSWLGG